MTERGLSIRELNRALLARQLLLQRSSAPLAQAIERAQILHEPYRPLVFDTSTPHSVSTFLVDGALAGTWRYEGGRVRFEPFGPLPHSTRRELQDEAKHLAAFPAD